MRVISRSPTSSPLVSILIRLMKPSIDVATAGKFSRSQSPSNRGGIASNSSLLMLTMPVTWVMPSS